MRRAARGGRRSTGGKRSAASTWFERLKDIDRELAAPRSVESWLALYDDRKAHVATMPPGGEVYVGARS